MQFHFLLQVEVCTCLKVKNEQLVFFFNDWDGFRPRHFMTDETC